MTALRTKGWEFDTVPFWDGNPCSYSPMSLLAAPVCSASSGLPKAGSPIEAHPEKACSFANGLAIICDLNFYGCSKDTQRI
jgi:hypothetical protein